MYTHYNSLQEEDRKVLLTYLKNFCAHKTREGYSYSEYLYKLTLIDFDEILSKENGIISPLRFNSTVDVFVNTNAVDKALDFIHQFVQYLPTYEKDSTIALANAQVAFVQEEYERVIQLLDTIESTIAFSNLRIWWLLSASYYKYYVGYKDGNDFIIEQCKKMKRNVKRYKSFSKKQKQGTCNLADFIIAFVINKKSTQELHEDLEHTEDMFLRKWVEKEIALKSNHG